jgi:integrase
MISFNVELNSKPAKGSNVHTLLLRITVNRRHARLGLIYSISPSHFNPNGKLGKYVRSSCSEHAKINKYIVNKIIQAKDIVTSLENDNKLITAQIIKEKMTESKTHDFFKFVDSYVEELKKNGNVGTYKKYSAVVQSNKDFTDSDSLLFEEIDSTFLNRYEAHLKKADKKQTTVAGYLSKLRSLFKKAIDAGLFEFSDSPFISFRIKQGKPSKDRLSEQEITKIEELELEKGSLLANVRNAFLFSFYNAGIRISDILLMTWDNIKDDRLVYTMYKTNKPHSLKLKKKPLEILEKYKGNDDSYIFPFFSDRFDYSDPMFMHNQIGAKTALINKYLKEISKKAGINKKVTTHTARHSFADIARQKTDNIYNLSKTLGHSSIKITEAYLATFDEKAVDDTLDSVFKN